MSSDHPVGQESDVAEQLDMAVQAVKLAIASVMRRCVGRRVAQ